MPTLYLIPTPLSPESQEHVLPAEVFTTVKHLTHFFAEDIRTARRFISSLKQNIDINSLCFEILDKKTPIDSIKKILQKTPNDWGVLSEAGCPAVADPGSLAVQVAHQLAWQVKPLTGPSSIILALMASGMNGQSFAFQGYLPIEKEARQNAIQVLGAVAKSKRQTQIIIETPYRNNIVLKDLIQFLPSESLLCVACNLTDKDEYIKTYSVSDWKKTTLPDLHKKPTIFLWL